MSKSVDRYIVLHAIRHRCMRFSVGTQVCGMLVWLCVRYCSEETAGIFGLRTYQTNRGLLVV